MTSGAVVRDSNQRLEVFIKGSYEKIKAANSLNFMQMLSIARVSSLVMCSSVEQALALPQTVPPDYDQVTMQCAKQNYYTLGISSKAQWLEART